MSGTRYTPQEFLVRLRRSKSNISKKNKLKQVNLQKLIAEAYIKNKDATSSMEDEPQENCVVLSCESLVSQMSFIPFPNKISLVKKWCKYLQLAEGLVKQRLEKGMSLSICCKHFDLQYDVLNYNAWITGDEPAQIDERAFPRFNMIVKKYKACFFPRCYNVSYQNPNVVFFDVPEIWEQRLQWFEAVGRAEVDKETRYCCEDHFNMNKDVKVTSTSFNVLPNVLPRQKSQIAKEEKLLALEELRLKKLEEEKINQNAKEQEEQKMSLDSLEDPFYWMNGGIETIKTENLGEKIEKIGVLTNDKVKEMFLLSLFGDLQEMSYSQLNFFKLEVFEIIKNIRS